MEDYSFSEISILPVEVELPHLLFHGGFPEDSMFNLEMGSKSEFLSTRLAPNGKDSAELSTVIRYGDGRPAPGIKVQFQVIPIHPMGWWRDPSEIRRRYERFNSQGWKNKKTIGTLSSSIVTSDSQGRVKVIYTSSHIGGDSTSRGGEEKIIMRLPNGTTSSAMVNLGVSGMREVHQVPGGLEFKNGTKGRFAQAELADFLESLGRKIKDSAWPHPLRLTDISYKYGGMIIPHKGHWYGLEIDFRPFSSDGKATSAGNKRCPKATNHASNYDRRRTKIICDLLNQTNPVKLLFNDTQISVTRCASGHHNHIHAQWVNYLVSMVGELEYDEFEYEVF